MKTCTTVTAKDVREWFLGLGLFSLALCVLSGCAGRAAYQYLDAALEYERQRRFEPALAAFRAAAEILPGDAYLRLELGRAYSRNGMYGEAALELEQALEMEPSYVHAFQEMSAVLKAQEMPDAAIGWLEQANRKVPGYFPLNAELAELYLQQDRFDEALTLLQGMAKRRPEKAWVHYNLGHLYQQLELSGKAEAAFEKAVAIDGSFARAHASLGNVLFGQKSYEEAAVAYRRAIEFNPRDHSSLNNLAWVYAVQGIRLDDGIRLSRRSLRLSPDRPTYLDTLAELHFRRGEPEQALRVIRYAIALNPEDPELREHLRRQLRRFAAAGRGKV